MKQEQIKEAIMKTVTGNCRVILNLKKNQKVLDSIFADSIMTIL